MKLELVNELVAYDEDGKPWIRVGWSWRPAVEYTLGELEPAPREPGEPLVNDDRRVA